MAMNYQPGLDEWTMSVQGLCAVVALLQLKWLSTQQRGQRTQRRRGVDSPLKADMADTE